MSSRLLGQACLLFPLVASWGLFGFKAVKASPHAFIAARVFKVSTASGIGSAFVLGPAENGGCILLTALHVIRENATNEPLLFQSPFGTNLSLNTNAFLRDVTLDLAFVPLASCKDSLALPLARASSILVSRKVEVLGYPVDLEFMNGAKAVPHSVRGRITQENAKTGYDLYYDAATKPGYSGGPVISGSGDEVIALHGLSDTAGEVQVPSDRERLRVGGGGVSSALIFNFLKSHGYVLPRSQKAPCLVGVC
jgi:S1-C subfamily serine protease